MKHSTQVVFQAWPVSTSIGVKTQFHTIYKFMYGFVVVYTNIKTWNWLCTPTFCWEACWGILLFITLQVSRDTTILLIYLEFRLIIWKLNANVFHGISSDRLLASHSTQVWPLWTAIFHFHWYQVAQIVWRWVNVSFWGEQESCCFTKYYVLLVFIILFVVLGSNFASFEVKCETSFAFRVSCTGPVNQCIFSMCHWIYEDLLVNQKKNHLLTSVSVQWLI